MPPKKRNLSQKNQDRTKNSKLMMISLKIDEYVYKNRPITTTDASLYLQEISLYKLQYNDVHTLQVIEKLEYCLKCIISEQKDASNGDDKCKDVGNEGNSSPVYSVPDKDMTQTMEIIENIPETTDIICIDITDDDADCNEPYKEICNISIDIHKAASDLTIEEQHNCSQSILQNYDINTNVFKGSAKTTNIQNKDVVKQNNCTKNITHYVPLKIPTIKGNSFEINKNLHIAQKAKFKPKPIKIVTPETIHIGGSTKKNTLKNTNSLNSINKPAQTQSVRIDNTNQNVSKVIERKATIKTSPAFKETVNKSAEIKPVVKKSKKRNKIVRATKINDKTRVIKDKGIKPHEKYINTNVQNTEKSVIKSCGSVIDLSWVENIRYVREITPDEYDVHITDSNFWNNLEIPSFLKAEDFDLM